MKNNWYVITGAPCSGKTTLLNELKRKGYKIVYEAARTLIDREMKKGKKLLEIRKNEFEFQRKVLRIKIQIEKRLSKKRIVFLERGIPDSFAYYEICGIKSDKYLKNISLSCFYKKIFILEILDYKKDYSRTEDLNKAQNLEKLLEKDYRKLKFPLIKVPVMSIDKRVAFVLNNIDL